MSADRWAFLNVCVCVCVCVISVRVKRGREKKDDIAHVSVLHRCDIQNKNDCVCCVCIISV